MRLKSAASIFLLGFAVLLSGADFFATTDPVAMNPALPYLPPESIHFRGPSGDLRLRPYIVRRRPVSGQFGAYTQQGAAALPLHFFVIEKQSSASLAEGSVKLRFCGIRSESPGALPGALPGDSPHFLGTDQYGRDVWSRLLYGGRTTVAIGLTAALCASLLGLGFGLIAGVYGGWVDALVMRLTEIMISVPWFYLLLALRAMLPLRTTPVAAVVMSTGLLALVGWARPARILRGAVLESRQRGYVKMARASGASLAHLVRWHLVPDVTPLAVTQFTILLPQFIASEVALSYFGLGVDEPLLSWGVLLTAAQHLSSLVDYPWVMSPIWAMLPFFLALHIVSDSRDRSPQLTMLTEPRLNSSLPLERV